MKDQELENLIVLRQFIANMNKAVFDRESVTIGGGEFSNTELKQVLTVIEGLVK